METIILGGFFRMKTLYIFTRDLRIRDNRALWEACRNSDEVASIYVFNDEDLRKRSFSKRDARLSLILEALLQISKYVKLSVFKGYTSEIAEYLLDKYRFDTVYISYPHTWREKEIVFEIERICSKTRVKLRVVFDNTLVDYRNIGEVRNFTSFFKKWIKQIDTNTVDKPPAEKFIEIDEPDLEEQMNKNSWEIVDSPWSLSRLKERLKEFDFSKYALTKDYPGIDGTSKLSPYISLGVISVRELYLKTHSLSSEFIRQLAWREYYYYLGLKYPWMKNLELKPFMRNIPWRDNEEYFKAFSKGKTGYPIVDAGIRQLLEENWMHNRVRLIVASFLVKDLHIDWKRGEEFFMKHLIDYDEVLNIGNWQWTSSVGVDPIPLRIFNPIQQAKKYDPDCSYVKRYVPELREYSCREIHDPLRNKLTGYHEPIVNHYVVIEEFRSMVFNKLTSDKQGR